MKQLPQCCCLFKADIKYLALLLIFFLIAQYFSCFFINFTPYSSHGPFSYQRDPRLSVTLGLPIQLQTSHIQL